MLTVPLVDALDEEGAAEHHGHHGAGRGVAHGELGCRDGVRARKKGDKSCGCRAGLTQALLSDPQHFSS